MKKEPILISPYKLDFITIETFAMHLAEKLDCSIKYKNGEIEGKNQLRTLHEQGTNENPEYVLEHGESAIIFYGEFLIMETAYDLNTYKFLKKEFEQNNSHKSYFNGEDILELKSLGVKELYCIKQKVVMRNLITNKTNWSQIKEKLVDNDNFFKVDL
nr:hypothetical protein [uncultured Flavobacterium sp.]